jgi:hypothetical protein
VAGIGDGFQEVCVALDAANILGWAGTLPSNHARIPDIWPGILQDFHHDLVLPSVAAIILISHTVLRPTQQILNAHATFILAMEIGLTIE